MRVILDTNVFVGAGFNRGSASARLLEAAREGRLTIVWSDATRRETRAVLTRIPRLKWEDVEALFRDEGRVEAEVWPDADFVTDPQDRKFAALSMGAGVPVVSSDDDLLSHSDRLDVVKPSEFLRQVEIPAD
ncbi:PIN domain-containing protein [Tranquillimonas alkanivorans]|uniref:Predicted nucleic acid-binding protein, contains PIN domain n=1 Tax=Tranquillimonas alkanivorans TaxID=441119 RepID=A0A1I5LJU3_9RHOB|nr:PIN domain-containing protein [Tranquillimonas alkanivorans]SFO97443.1 Predicted nucleic acid-binding protein, contains PIN domain [Tranquillimonas alkanivorans]